MKYQFVQPIYYFYEVEADSIEEAWQKTADISADDFYDEVVGDWQDATRED